MSETKLDRKEMRRICRMLREMSEFATHVSLTGSLKGGASFAIRQYDALIDHLRSTTALPPYLLINLGEEATLDEMGAAARFVGGYLKAVSEEEEDGEADEDPDRRRKRENQGVNVDVDLSGLKVVQDLKDVGRLLREHLPTAVKDEIREKRNEEREKRFEEKAKRDEARATLAEASEENAETLASLAEAREAHAEIRAEIAVDPEESEGFMELAERLRQADLTEDERQALADRLAALARIRTS